MPTRELERRYPLNHKREMIFVAWRQSLSLAILLLLTNCVAPPPPAPPPPVIKPVPAPPPPPPHAANWRDWPVTAGNWSYRIVAGGTTAQFGTAGKEALLTMRCESAAHFISITRVTDPTPPAGPMTIRTSYGAVSWPTETIADPTPPAPPAPGSAIAVRAATDPTLDQIAFSRGRFAVEIPGAEPLVMPASAEVSRVIEDCRS